MILKGDMLSFLVEDEVLDRVADFEPCLSEVRHLAEGHDVFDSLVIAETAILNRQAFGEIVRRSRVFQS